MMTAGQVNLVDLDVYEHNGPPHEQFAWLREHAPVFWHEYGGAPGWPGFWAVTSHEAVMEVSRHPEIFSSAERTVGFTEVPPVVVEVQRQVVINMDPPTHTRQRGLVNRGFTPRVIGQLEQRITEICADLLDKIAQRGEADFVSDLAAPLPVQVICELVGAPPEDRARLYELTNLMSGADDPEVSSYAEFASAFNEMGAYARQLRGLRRREPRDDIATRLIEPDENGDELTTAEFIHLIGALVFAGSETTRDAASGGMLAFFEQPQQWQRLLADPALIPAAAEEMVRWVSPVNLFRRTAMRDTELAGQKIAEGDKVVMFYTSANRDEHVFTSPQQFDIGRDPNPHLGFGFGPHFCLGQHLAALELRVFLRAVAERMPEITLDGPVARLRSYWMNGIKHMPVKFPAVG